MVGRLTSERHVAPRSLCWAGCYGLTADGQPLRVPASRARIGAGEARRSNSRARFRPLREQLGALRAFAQQPSASPQQRTIVRQRASVQPRARCTDGDGVLHRALRCRALPRGTGGTPPLAARTYVTSEILVYGFPKLWFKSDGRPARRGQRDERDHRPGRRPQTRAARRTRDHLESLQVSATIGPTEPSAPQTQVRLESGIRNGGCGKAT